MKRLFAYTDQIAAHTIVDDSLFSDVSQLPIDFKNADAWRDDDWKLPSAIKTAVQIMFFEDVQRHVEHF